jgi:hypothetical protein
MPEPVLPGNIFNILCLIVSLQCLARADSGNVHVSIEVHYEDHENDERITRIGVILMVAITVTLQRLLRRLCSDWLGPRSTIRMSHLQYL